MKIANQRSGLDLVLSEDFFFIKHLVLEIEIQHENITFITLAIVARGKLTDEYLARNE